MTDRCIATRLLEACAIQAIACFSADPRLTSLYSDGRGTWKIEPGALLPQGPSGIQLPAMRIVRTPMTYLTGVGSATMTEYTATFQFLMNMKALVFKRGGRA